MPVPRREVFNPEESNYYHCYTRCVRRAFLCGFDNYTGKSFEHRRSWIRERLSLLLKVFAMDLAAYAIMENHLHSVLRNRPDIAATWSPVEVATRWRTIFPKHGPTISEEARSLEIQAIAADTKRICLYRSRLSDLSWFHRCLNENIARRANAEDDCKGRFWEGRFRSEPLTDPASVLACSVYVELNPIKARKAETLESSDCTSIKDRILNELGRSQPCSGPRLLPVEEFCPTIVAATEYISLVRESAAYLVDQRQELSARTREILRNLSIQERYWSTFLTKKASLFKKVMGSSSAMRAFAQQRNKRWVHGLTAARLIFAG